MLYVNQTLNSEVPRSDTVRNPASMSYVLPLSLRQRVPRAAPDLESELTAESEQCHSGHRKARERDEADDNVPWQQSFKLVGMMMSNMTLSEKGWFGETICLWG